MSVTEGGRPMTENEMIDALKTLLTPISNKLEDIELKLEQLQIENKIEHRQIRKDIARLDDEMETIVTVLQGKGILPNAQ